MLVLLAEEFDTSVSTLLGETIHEESLNEGSIKNISEKLEVINLQLAKRNEMRVRTIRCLFITVCVIIVVVFIAFAGINSEYLTWNFNDPELAIVGTLLHGFEFLFVRLAPLVLLVLLLELYIHIENDNGNMDAKQCYAIEHLERLFYKDLRWQKCYTYIIQMSAILHKGKA